ncbi:protein vav-like [Oppia nitens]|uniref:protein vav-like n=1 Tax=Oppia nitens TaxID=1686743 RepID=UPI0023DC921B|nr:protein vav-like [Oppia nitens]
MCDTIDAMCETTNTDSWVPPILPPLPSSSSSTTPPVSAPTPTPMTSSSNDQHVSTHALPHHNNHHNNQQQHRQQQQQQHLMSLELPSSPSLSHRTHEEEIYEDLCYVTLRLGRHHHRDGGSSADRAVSLVLDCTTARDYCVKELVETERNYCDALHMIQTHFIQPLSKQLRTIDKLTIFQNIKHLLDIHNRFYSDLCNNTVIGGSDHHHHSLSSHHHSIQAPITSYDSLRISASFLHYKDKLIVYGQYCANLPKAQQLIDQICLTDETIAQLVNKCQMKANEGKFKLRDLLSLPMQRILKYHLLLSQLIKNTPETHEDFSGLQKSYQAMLDLGLYINEVKRDTETLDIINDIQNSIVDLEMPDNTQLKDYGRLIKDGELKIRSHEESRLKNRYVFIFDKVMLMCKSIRGEQYSYKEALILADYQVITVEEHSMGSTISKLTKQWSFGWSLVHRQNKSTYTFYSKSDDIRRKWIEAIDKALDNVCPQACREGSTDHTFEMFTFLTITTCADCQQLLRGTFFQGYQCTVCNIAVHKQCIASVRSCGAPSLPPRPPLPPSSPGISLNSFSGEEDNIRNSVSDSLSRNCSQITGAINTNSSANNVNRSYCRAISSFNGDPNLGELAFIVQDIIVITSTGAKCSDEDQSSDDIWWEGRNTRTFESGIFPSTTVTEVDLALDLSVFSASATGRQSYEDPNGFSEVDNCASGGGAQYVEHSNLNLDDYLWFAGPMDRDSAQSVLEHMLNGSFLVRISPKQNGSYAISLNYSGQVKHIRVQRTVEHQLYYLSESRYFKSIIDLIVYYSENSLCESFNLVNTCLQIPFKKSYKCDAYCYAIALYNFAGGSANLLDLRKGDRVTILSKAGQSKGWWKGQINDRIGYFPMAYVQ